MEDPSDDDIVYSKNVIEFLTVANEFCLFTEKAENYLKEDIINYMLKICPLIYLKGALLPASEENEFEITERYVNEEHWEAVYNSLKKKMGKDDSYWTISTNNDSYRDAENVPVMTSISENLADIYQDLKDFTMLYQKGTHASKENAIAECCMLFRTHWGFRIVSVHKALHHVAYPETMPDNFYETDN